MQLPTCGGQHLTAIIDRAALPVGDDAARSLDHRNRGLHVIGFEAGLDHQIDLTGSDQRIGIAIGAIPDQPGLRGNAAEGSTLIRGAHFGEGGKQDSFGQRTRTADAKRRLAGS